MRIVDARLYRILPIGKQGENLATKVVFPIVKEWERLYGDGTFQLICQRKTDAEPYAAPVEVDGDTVIWNVRDVDVGVVGLGRCELLYFVNL